MAGDGPVVAFAVFVGAFLLVLLVAALGVLAGRALRRRWRQRRRGWKVDGG
ncbi:MAG TPA: hypothetical protein VG817_11900 [Gemmatimonadales bacterium]|nr:hypothetical protein [Gemmatimonadales bacterium]